MDLNSFLGNNDKRLFKIKFISAETKIIRGLSPLGLLQILVKFINTKIFSNSMEETIVTKSVQQTRELGEKVARELTGGSILVLYGELGSGKTTFVQGLAKGLGIKKRVISPTFIIIRSYALKSQKLKFFYHIDLYRVEDQEDLQGLGLEEILADPQNIIAIEWAENLGDLLPKKRWDVWFEYIEEEKRKITWKKM